jgi:hypothetical protein
LTVPVFILLRQRITSDESWCDADQPTTLFTWPHASRRLFVSQSENRPPSTIKKGGYQDMDDNKRNISAELEDFFLNFFYSFSSCVGQLSESCKKCVSVMGDQTVYILCVTCLNCWWTYSSSVSLIYTKGRVYGVECAHHKWPLHLRCYFTRYPAGQAVVVDK